MSKLLIHEHPLILLPTLAARIGLNQALMVQQMYYWHQRIRTAEDGHRWMKMTAEDWQKQFPFWSVNTIRRTIAKLEGDGVLVSTQKWNHNPIDKTKWYRLDIDKLPQEFDDPSAPEDAADLPESPESADEVEEPDAPTTQSGYSTTQNEQSTTQSGASTTQSGQCIRKETSITTDFQQQQQGACAPAAVSPDGDMPAAPAEQSEEAPTDLLPVVESLRKRGFSRRDAETLAVEHGAERVRLELSRLEWGLRHPAWAAQRRNVPGWIRGSLATEGGYAIPPGFTGPEDRQRRERQRRRKAAMAAAAEKAREEEDARAADERARREREWEALPAEVRGDVERVALETLKARDPLTHKLIQGVIDRGDDPRPTGLWDAVQEIRQQLIRERETMGVV